MKLNTDEVFKPERRKPRNIFTSSGDPRNIVEKVEERDPESTAVFKLVIWFGLIYVVVMLFTDWIG